MANNVNSSSLKMSQMRHSIDLRQQVIYRLLASFLKNVSIKLAYEYKNTANDNRLMVKIEPIVNFFFIYFPLLYIIRVLQRFLLKKPYYPFIDEIIQTTTRIIFTRSQRSGQHICLKLWRRTENEVCDERLIVRNDDYLIEGLAFNKKFAPRIYLGVATVIVDDDNKHIQRGPLIESPTPEQLMNGKRYALVMKTLKQEQRLDYQLINKKIGVGFLAHEIAQMHYCLERPDGSDLYGMPDKISAKLNLNNELFLEAINKLTLPKYKKYRWIGTCLADACHTYSSLFASRSSEGHIKRCHGDLKATNLWVRSFPIPYFQSYFPPELLALDCIDFKPDFCLIDTLSDVAMLAIDLERLYPQETERAEKFLLHYLIDMQEDYERVKPLLEYYQTEKAMVCCYVSILFDNQPELGKKYLQIAYNHVRRLQKLNKAAKRQRETVPQHESALSTTIPPLALAEDADRDQEKLLVHSS